MSGVFIYVLWVLSSLTPYLISRTLVTYTYLDPKVPGVYLIGRFKDFWILNRTVGPGTEKRGPKELRLLHRLETFLVEGVEESAGPFWDSCN